MHKTILILLVMSGALSACHKKQEVFYAAYKPITQSVYASGTVKGKNQYQVYARTAGIIQDIYVNEGDFIKKGQAILKIDNQALSLSTSNALATAQFNDLKLNQDKLIELQHSIEVLKETYLEDSLLWLRQQNLFQQQVGSKLELEQRSLSFKRSKANYLSLIHI